MKISFEPTALEHLNYWITTDAKTAAKIMTLLKDTARTPFKGLGKPERLKHNLSGKWSRRIDDENRLVYEVKENEIVVVSCRFHYS